jgi:hypothetical protein
VAGVAKKSKYDGKNPAYSRSGFDEAMELVGANPSAIIATHGLTQVQQAKIEAARDLALRKSWKPSPPSTAAMPFQIPSDRALCQAFTMCAQHLGQDELKLRYGWMPHYDRIWDEVFGGEDF